MVVAAACSTSDSGGSDDVDPSAGTVDINTSEDRCDSPPVLDAGFDVYGGWKGIARDATGRFSVGEVDGRSWLFTPDGNAFLASGPTGIRPLGTTIGATGESPYHDAVLARYGSEEAWADATLERLCDLGVRTLGGWVDDDVIELFESRIAYTVNVDVYLALPPLDSDLPGSTPRRDVFAPAVEDLVGEAMASDEVSRCAEDPWCIGVFVENETPYAPSALEGGSHLDAYLDQPGGTPGKQRAQAFLEDRYDGDLDAFNTAWDSELSSWDDIQELDALGECTPAIALDDDLCVLRSGTTRAQDVISFEAEVARHLAGLADDELAAVDPAILNLGPRLVVNPYYAEVLVALTERADVVSVNNYDIDDTLGPLLSEDVSSALLDVGAVATTEPFERLEQIHEVTGKPLWISEWFYRVARPEGTWPPFLPERPDPGSRADAAGTYLERVLAMPFVVGESWFQWSDQPVEGRADGENQLIGIVDIDDDADTVLWDTFAAIYATAVERHLDGS